MWHREGTWLTFCPQSVIPSALFSSLQLPHHFIFQELSLQSHSHSFHCSSHPTAPGHQFLPVSLLPLNLCFLCAAASLPAVSLQSRGAFPAWNPEFNCPLLEFPDHGAIQAANCISCTAEVNGNLDQLFGALLQSSSKIPYFLIFLLIFVSSHSTRIITIPLYHQLWYRRSYLQHTPWSLFSSTGSRRGEKKTFSCWTDVSWFSLFLFWFCHSLLS